MACRVEQALSEPEADKAAGRDMPGVERSRADSRNRADKPAGRHNQVGKDRAVEHSLEDRHSRVADIQVAADKVVGDKAGPEVVQPVGLLAEQEPPQGRVAAQVPVPGTVLHLQV